MTSRARRAAALAVALLALAACTSGDDAADPEPSGTAGGAVATTTVPPSTTTTLVGQALVVAEQGFSTYPDPIDPLATLGGYGVVLQNPNPDLMATGVRVVTRILDAAGAELVKDSAVLNAVMPGQPMAVGRTLLEPIVEPTTLDVQVEVAAWLPPPDPSGLLSASEVVTEPVVDGGSTTTFTVTSTWQDAEEVVDVTAVYRAADGRILGAESTTIDAIAARGTARGVIQLLSPVPDLARTDVYVGRGIGAQTTG